jgi:hypothetical protein
VNKRWEILLSANGHKVDVDSVAFHGETLKILCLVNGGIHRRDRSRCIDPSDLMKTAASAVHILWPDIPIDICMIRPSQILEW